MTDAQFEEYKQIIEDEIASLKLTITSLTESVKPISTDTAIGRLSRMEAIQAQSIAQSNLRSKKMRQQRLEEALLRLNRGNFGICSVCEEDISDKRLKIAPESTVCMDCLQR
ncbi:MAG: hypothetical protein C0603_07985 [Denitrovibrio sp.]|nr:MAG: hypothetical protein C0603_07985 [Denitrovibrio sp.]